MASEAQKLKKETKDRLQAMGIDYDLDEDCPKRDDKAALKREKAAKALFEFPLPLRCCWLYPKVRMPGMRMHDDPYEFCKEDLKRGRKFPFPSNVLSRRWEVLTDQAEIKSDRESSKSWVKHPVGPLGPDATHCPSWYSRNEVKHPNACDLIGGGYLYSDRVRLLPLNDDDLESPSCRSGEEEWKAELGRLVFDADCLSGGGENEIKSVEKYLDVLQLTEEKTRRSNCYVMFMNKSEKVLLYVEDPHLNVASYYVLTHETPEGEYCAAQALLISQHRPFNSGIQCFVRSVEPPAFSSNLGADEEIKSTRFRVTISFMLTATGLVDATLNAINQRPHHDAVKALCRVLLGIVAAVDEDDAVYSRRDEIDSFYDHIYDYHTNKPPGDYAERVMDRCIEIQRPGLNPTLRPYQVQAVKWMMELERGLPVADSDLEQRSDVLFDRVVTHDGQVIFFNRYTGTFLKERPQLPNLPNGGILADEMGLGKTVEMLALIMCHPSPPIEPEADLPTIEVAKEDEDKKKDGGLRSQIALKVVAGALKKKEDLTQIEVKKRVEEELAKMKKKEEKEKKKSEKSDGTKEDEDEGDRSDDEEGEKEEEEEYLPSSAAKNKAKSVKGKSLVKGVAGKKTTESSTSQGKRLPRKRKQNGGETGEEVPVEAPRGKKSRGKAGEQSEEVAVKVSLSSAVLVDHDYVAHAPLEDITNQRTSKRSSSKRIDGTAADIEEREEVKEEPKEEPKEEVNDGPMEEVVGGPNNGLLVEVKEEAKHEVLKEVSTWSKHVEAAPRPSPSPLPPSEENTVDGIAWLSGIAQKKNVEPVDPSEEPRVERPRINPKNVFLPPTVDIRQVNLLECSCGVRTKDRDRAGQHRVQCNTCGMMQHAECVGYDLSDPKRGPYHCPHCWSSRACPPCLSAATLIVSPSTICYQWNDEIAKHINEKAGLKVFIYGGMAAQGFIYPKKMAQYDLVITTYETFQREVDFLDLPSFRSNEGRKLRNPKRYVGRPTPLTGIKWWRICLDEAQMVEGVSTKMAQMALRLDAINRWCVTGTPINKGLSDLYGLLLFLGLEPYSTAQWWEKCLLDPYRVGLRRPMHDVMTRVFWRSAKKHVSGEINLPPQTNQITWLQFSPVEDHFYRRQNHLAITDASKSAVFRQRQASADTTHLSSLDRYTLNALLAPLLRLRQACCHPQIVRGEMVSFGRSTKSNMSMEQLLTEMINLSTKEATDAHRQLIAAMNGLAGIHILNKDFPAAVEEYRDVIRSIESHVDRLHTDSLQQLHTYHNLHWILTTVKPHGVAPTLRDHKLKEQMEEIRNKYVSKTTVAVTAARDVYQDAGKAVTKLSGGIKDDCALSNPSALSAARNKGFGKGRPQKNFSSKTADGLPWYIDLLERVDERMEDGVLSRVQEELDQGLAGTKSWGSYSMQFNDLRGLKYAVYQKLSQLEEARKSLVEAVMELNKKHPFSKELVEAAVTCHLRPSGMRKNNCGFCLADKLFENYESRLFAMAKMKHVLEGEEEEDGEQQEQEEDEAGPSSAGVRLQGSWADSEVERSLKALLQFAKSQVTFAMGEVAERATNHMKLFSSWKKEFKALRGLWIALGEHVAAMDELDMATERFRFRLPNESIYDNSAVNVVDLHEISGQRIRLKNDRSVSAADLKKKLGTLLYLENMRRGASHSLVEETEEDSEEKRDEGGTASSSASAKCVPTLINPEPCSICLNSLGGEWSVLRCGHCFCHDCVATLLERKRGHPVGARSSQEPALKHVKIQCALCRDPTAFDEIRYVTTRQRRDEKETVKVRGSHSTKVEAVARKIIEIQRSDDEARILVFSTWSEVLRLIGAALAENDVGCLSFCRSGMTKTKVLDMFRSKKSTSKVLLLPISSGANGLNLIQANHVILVEPIMNLAAEYQAIGRIHRIGQLKPTFVHRFIVSGTIEERLYNMLKTFQEKQRQDDLSSKEVSDEDHETAGMTIGDLTKLLSDTNPNAQSRDDDGEDDEEPINPALYEFADTDDDDY